MQKTVCLEKNDKGVDYAAGMEEQNLKVMKENQQLSLFDAAVPGHI